MRSRTLAVLIAGALLCAGCGVLPGTGQPSTPPTPSAPSAAAAASPVASPAASPGSAASPAAATSAPASATAASKPEAPANTVYVGNTDGEGVFLRKTPAMDDKASAYPDGTALTIIGDDVQGDGQTWKHVRTPDGAEGYVPAQYTTDTPQ